MKKLAILLLAVLVAVPLVGCGEKANAPQDSMEGLLKQAKKDNPGDGTIKTHAGSGANKADKDAAPPNGPPDGG